MRSTGTEPVDGSNPATDWNGVLSIDESPNVLNPPNGWIQNTNNWPFTAAGPNSPKKADYPPYVETGTDNPRGIHAVRVLDARKDFTPESLDCRGLRSRASRVRPAHADAAERLRRNGRGRSASPETRGADRAAERLGSPMVGRRRCRRRWRSSGARNSGSAWRRMRARPTSRSTSSWKPAPPPRSAWTRLVAVVDKLTADFGTWKLPWGDVNRFQRLTGDIVQPFDDSKPSLADRLHLVALGIAGVVWSAVVQRHEEDLRHDGEQLPGRGGVRRPRACQGRFRRRAERRPGLASLQRSGRAVCGRRSARRLLLSRSTAGAHRAHLPSGRVIGLDGSQTALRSAKEDLRAEQECAETSRRSRTSRRPPPTTRFARQRIQFVRKLSGTNRPSRANEEAFNRAVDEVFNSARRLIDSSVHEGAAPQPEEEAEQGAERSRQRFGEATPPVRARGSPPTRSKGSNPKAAATDGRRFEFALMS